MPAPEYLSGKVIRIICNSLNHGSCLCLVRRINVTVIVPGVIVPGWTARLDAHLPGTASIQALARREIVEFHSNGRRCGHSGAGVRQLTENGRGGGIRTPDPLLPKQMRYQTALRPDC